LIWESLGRIAMENGERFLRQRLSNGTQVVGEPMAGVQSAAVGLLFGVGARDESAKHFGISHFLEQMIFRGTEHRSAREISEQFDRLGASYDSSAGIEMHVMSCQMLGDRLLEALDLLGDCARFPAFPDDAVESVRTLQLQEISQRDDRPPQKVMDLVRRELFAGSPLGNDVLGSPETMENIDRQALAEYHKRFFRPDNAVISVAGNFDWAPLIQKLEALTADWPVGTQRDRLSPPEPHQSVTVLSKEDASQENLGFAFPGVAASDPRYHAAGLTAQALGGGTNSRLHREVREKRGLAYAAQARFDGFENTGLVRIYVGTSPERAPESVEVVLGELRKLEADGLEPEELDRAKTRLKSQVIMRSESTYARMATNMRSWWMERQLYSLDEAKQRIDRVTLGEVAALLRDLGVTHRIAAVALGPRSRQDLFQSEMVPS
jgi:predicted Zn-dependent peptidase